MEIHKFLKVLSNPGRLAVFKCIATTCCDCDESKGLQNGNCVTNISKVLKMPQPTTSNYVKALHRAGLISKKRKGKNIYFYAISGGENILKLIESI